MVDVIGSTFLLNSFSMFEFDRDHLATLQDLPFVAFEFAPGEKLDDSK
jgi:hypothetical protein